MKSPVEILLKTSRFSVVRKMIRLPDGAVVNRDTVQHPGAVTMLPLLDDDRVCLIRNHRVAVDETLIELPAGTLEPNEDPADTARRELAEETGYRCGSLRRIHEFFMSPGILSERMVLFLASDLSPGAAALEPGEEIEVLPTRWSEAMTMAEDGRIHDAKTLIGLFYYDRLRRK